MSDSIEHVEAEAMQLSLEDRTRLVERLIQSLDEAEAEDPKVIDRLWKAEIERRVAAYDAGDTESIPAENVFGKARSLVRGQQ